MSSSHRSGSSDSSGDFKKDERLVVSPFMSIRLSNPFQFQKGGKIFTFVNADENDLLFCKGSRHDHTTGTFAIEATDPSVLSTIYIPWRAWISFSPTEIKEWQRQLAQRQDESKPSDPGSEMHIRETLLFRTARVMLDGKLHFNRQCAVQTDLAYLFEPFACFPDEFERFLSFLGFQIPTHFSEGQFGEHFVNEAAAIATAAYHIITPGSALPSTMDISPVVSEVVADYQREPSRAFRTLSDALQARICPRFNAYDLAYQRQKYGAKNLLREPVESCTPEEISMEISDVLDRALDDFQGSDSQTVHKETTDTPTVLNILKILKKPNAESIKNALDSLKTLSLPARHFIAICFINIISEHLGSRDKKNLHPLYAWVKAPFFFASTEYIDILNLLKKTNNFGKKYLACLLVAHILIPRQSFGPSLTALPLVVGGAGALPPRPTVREPASNGLGAINKRRIEELSEKFRPKGEGLPESEFEHERPPVFVPAGPFSGVVRIPTSSKAVTNGQEKISIPILGTTTFATSPTSSFSSRGSSRSGHKSDSDSATKNSLEAIPVIVLPPPPQNAFSFAAAVTPPPLPVSPPMAHLSPTISEAECAEENADSAEGTWA